MSEDGPPPVLSARMQRQIERLLDEADQAVRALDWATVRDRAEAALGLDSANADALAYLAAAVDKIGERSATAESNISTETATAFAANDAALPSSFVQGRYAVKRLLGEGSTKRVYLTHDNRLDRDVAFSLMKSDGLDAEGLLRITREAQAMGRLGDHPHIVSVFDIGEEGGAPYLVSQLMGGGDLRDLIERAQDHRVPLAEALRIADEVCRALEHAHTHGVIHRDLKPGNVWMTEDGTAKLGDFGLALSLERSRLTQAGMTVGTVAYMAPEQAIGGAVTERSDLYSLGCMLYELLTGRPPFLGQDYVGVIGQHLNTPPVAPSWHNAACPRPLEGLILRLLSKDPNERPHSASDVRQALAGIDLKAMSSDEWRTGEAPNALDSLAAGVFVGRQREMGELKAALEDALSGRGRIALLTGEPGIGKTRTSQELATYAGLRGAQVLWGRCYEGAGAPPYWPWVQAMRSYVREHDDAQLLSEMGAGARDIAEITPDIRLRFPDLPASAILAPEEARFRLFDSVTAFLKSASQHQPLVLVLEDLHWADRPSLLLLEFLAKELGGARLLLVGTYRDVEVSRQHPLSLTLAELTRERRCERMLLGGLTRDDVGKFIALTTGAEPPTELTDAVYTQTEGNPLFVTELVRLLAQESDLSGHRGSNQDDWAVRIPVGVREVIGRRLHRLSDQCIETLTVGAVIGREFGLDQLNRLIDDRSEDELLDFVEEALAARVIEELPRSVARYQFTHALIQQTLADELTGVRRERLRLRIAETIEELYGADADAHAAELMMAASVREITILVTDIRGFTNTAGEKEPTALIAYLNRYFAKMTPVIVKYDGEVDKYSGDAILAKFGAGEWHPDHARRAVFAMLEMIDACDALDEELKTEGQPIIRMGIGVDSGPATLGNFGSPERMEYTFISNVAHGANRAQELTKELGWDLLICEPTYEQARDSIEVGEPWPVHMRGFEEATHVYPVLGRKNDVAPWRRAAYEALRRDGRSIYADFYESLEDGLTGRAGP